MTIWDIVIIIVVIATLPILPPIGQVRLITPLAPLRRNGWRFPMSNRVAPTTNKLVFISIADHALYYVYMYSPDDSTQTPLAQVISTSTPELVSQLLIILYD